MSRHGPTWMMNIDRKYTVYVHFIRILLVQKGIPFLGRHPIFFQVFTQRKTMSPQNFCRLKRLGFWRLKNRWDAMGCGLWELYPLVTLQKKQGTYFSNVYKFIVNGRYPPLKHETCNIAIASCEFLLQIFREIWAGSASPKRSTTMPIQKLHARQVFDSRGNPTVEVGKCCEDVGVP